MRRSCGVVRAAGAAAVAWAMAASGAGAQVPSPGQVPAPANAGGDEWLRHPVDDKTFAAFQSFFRYDRQLPLDMQVLQAADSDGLAREHLTFQSTTGARVFARLYERLPKAMGRQPAIIFVHGANAAGKDGAGSRAMAEFIARAGYRVLAIDMLHYGERKTDVVTSFTSQELRERLYNQRATYLAFVTQTVKDVGRAYDLLVEQRGADPKRVALVGFSRGAVLALIAGGADRRLVAVAALFAGHMIVGEEGHEAAACPANYVGRISPRPLFLMNGRNDVVFLGESSVEPIHRLAKQPVQVTWLDTGHRTPPEDQLGTFAQWMERVLRSGAPPP